MPLTLYIYLSINLKLYPWQCNFVVHKDLLRWISSTFIYRWHDDSVKALCKVRIPSLCPGWLEQANLIHMVPGCRGAVVSTLAQKAGDGVQTPLAHPRFSHWPVDVSITLLLLTSNSALWRFHIALDLLLDICMLVEEIVCNTFLPRYNCLL